MAYCQRAHVAEDGLGLAERLGAQAVVDGRSGDIVAAARAFAPGGVDAVLGLAGGDSLERCVDALRPGGRLAFPAGVRPEPRARPGLDAVRYNAIAGPAEFERLNQAIAAAKLEVPIAAEFPLNGDAIEQLHAGAFPKADEWRKAITAFMDSRGARQRALRGQCSSTWGLRVSSPRRSNTYDPTEGATTHP